MAVPQHSLMARVPTTTACFSRRGLGATRGKRMEIWMKFVSSLMNER